MFDDITIDDLRAAGSVKWSGYPGAIGAFIAEMDFGTAPAVSRAVTEAVERGQFGYLPGRLKRPMGEAYAQFASRRYGQDLDPDDVRVLPDVLEGLITVVEHFTPPDSPIIVPTPAYMPFLTLPRELGREIATVPMVRDGQQYVYDLDALAAAFTVPGQVFVLCNPHNPIGRVLTESELLAIAEVVDSRGGIVFSDEIHAPLTYPGYRHIPYASLNDVTASHTITATSTSKAWNIPGLKTAQLILSNDAHRAKWNEVSRRVEHLASTIGVIAAISAYNDGEAWLETVLSYLDRARLDLSDLVAAHLPGVRYTPPQGTYLAWLDARDLSLPQEPSQYMLQHAGVATTSGVDCGAPGFIRFNFATPAPILTHAIQAMGAALPT